MYCMAGKYLVDLRIGRTGQKPNHADRDDSETCCKNFAHAPAPTKLLKMLAPQAFAPQPVNTCHVIFFS